MFLCNKSCEKLTKMTTETQNKKLRLFARIGIVRKLEIINEQKSLFHKMKYTNGDIDNNLLTFTSLVLAIDLVTKKIDILDLNVNKLKFKNRKRNLKREKLLTVWAVVKILKEEQEMSFREISFYLQKYHKIEVSYSLICQMWNELENNTKIKEN